jgi:hypothetical protein
VQAAETTVPPNPTKWSKATAKSALQNQRVHMRVGNLSRARRTEEEQLQNERQARKAIDNFWKGRKAAKEDAGSLFEFSMFIYKDCTLLKHYDSM